jgi:DNA ligase-associated metallophosphoesterase
MTSVLDNSDEALIVVTMTVDGSLTIEWHGERLALLRQRAVHWSRCSTLIIADPHFGKAAAFRSAGIPVPGGTTACDLGRLSELLNARRADRLIILGDLLHARGGRAESTFKEIARWRANHHQLDIIIVRGNHDAHAGDPPDDWRFRCIDPPMIQPPLAFAHEPCPRKGCGVLAGHIHPGASLHDESGMSMRLPCFIFRDDHAVLPAFGTFTGLHPVRPRRGSQDRVFAVGPDRVVEVARERARRREPQMNADGRR